MSEPVVLVHGGAGNLPEASRAQHVLGCEEAARVGAEVLRQGGSALDAVCAAVVSLEDNPIFNAGTGGSLTRTGELELDAAVMRGVDLAVGALTGLSPVKNPVKVARALLLSEGPHVFYAGRGADAVARRLGFDAAEASMVTDAALARLAEWRAGKVGGNWAGGTVGAVALDGEGHVAAATSTGGTMGKDPGRVGDSPIIGAGTWADDADAAVSCTGEGEAFLRLGLARVVASLTNDHGPQRASELALDRLRARVGGKGGLISVSRSGELGVAKLTNTMSFAWERISGDARSGY